jgi:hypothetical protein
MKTIVLDAAILGRVPQRPGLSRGRERRQKPLEKRLFFLDWIANFIAGKGLAGISNRSALD